MTITVSKVTDQESVKIGIFYDIENANLFIKALMDRDNEQKQDGRYLIDIQPNE